MSSDFRLSENEKYFKLLCVFIQRIHSSNYHDEGSLIGGEKKQRTYVPNNITLIDAQYLHFESKDNKKRLTNFDKIENIPLLVSASIEILDESKG